MSQWDKLEEQIKSLSKVARFDELKKILEYYGYSMKGPRGGSSHATFRKKGRSPITIPQKDPVKRVYVRMVRDVIMQEEKEEQEA